MPNNLLCLYPKFDTACLNGLYLNHLLHKIGSAYRPFVYANFLSSIDGRIALDDSGMSDSYTPRQMKSASDFSLFMELHAQADCLITHGGYLRALNRGHLGNILQVHQPDLIEWRLNQGLSAQPAVVIASATLDFPLHESLHLSGQAVYIATGTKADQTRVNYWKSRGYSVLIAGDGRMVKGEPLVTQLGALGFQSLYLIAGPQMLDTMIRGRQLSRLYLTLSHQLIGGENFHSLIAGSHFESEANLILQSLYYEKKPPPDSGQFFLQFSLNQN